MDPLEIVARPFVQERGMHPKERDIGFLARKDQITIIYFNDPTRQRLLLSKKFPALRQKYESTILVSEKDQALYLHVLRGCLQDYVTLLEKATGSFCRSVQMALSSYLLEENKKPEETVSEKMTPFKYNWFS